MLLNALVPALMLSLVLSTVPLPYSDDGTTTIPPGGEWTYDMDLGVRAHMTSIVRSDRPVEVKLLRGHQGENASEPPIDQALSTTLYRPTEDLEAGAYRLVVTNPGPGEARIDYQVYEDFIVVANMTAKNVMGLSLALAMGIVALFLYGRPRRP